MEMNQGTQAWLDWRKTKIGASEIASILGCGYQTPLQLWEIKKDLRESPFNPAMLKGREFEEQIRQWYEDETNEIMFPAVCEHPKYEWMIASYDGLSECETFAVEIKYNNREYHQLALEGKLPKRHFWQCQQQIAVRNLRRVDYVSYNESLDTYAKVEVFPDDEAIDRIIEKGSEFAMLLETNEAPSTSEGDYQERNDALYIETCRALQEVQVELEGYSELLQKEKDLKDTLKRLSGDTNTYGGGYRVTRFIRKGPIQYKDIPALADIDIEKHRGPAIVQWRISRIKE